MVAYQIRELFTSAQDGAAVVVGDWLDRCAMKLWNIALEDADVTATTVTECVDHLLAVTERNIFVERCVRFLSVFTSKTPLDNEPAFAVIEEILQHLTTRLCALDKAVRLKCCQLVSCILAALREGLLLEDSVAESLRQSLIERLQDKVPAIRAETCRALSHLEVSEVESVAEAMTTLLNVDKSKDVRTAVVQSLPLSSAMLPVLLERLRDINPMVRRAVVVRLRSLSIKTLSIQQRAEVIQQVLQDRDAAVADAAAQLLTHWLHQDFNGDPIQLLRALDIETYPDAATRAVESLINSGSIRCLDRNHSSSPAASSDCVTAYVDSASRSSGQPGGLVGLSVLAGQDAESQRLLEPHEALLWRCLSEWLHCDAISKGLAAATTGGARAVVQAAVAAERHEVLERALPESAEQLIKLAMRHAAAGPATRFSTTQLLIIAANCVEWSDAASRCMALPYLQQLIALSPATESKQLQALQGHPDADDSSSVSSVDTAGLQLVGNGGDGQFEAAVVQLVLAVQGSDAEFISTMLDGIAALAAGAGLLLNEGFQDGAATPSFSVDAADASQVFQCLAYTRLMLQQLHSGLPVHHTTHGALTISSLWELLLLLALKQDHLAVRAEAVECIGLYALVAPNSSRLLPATVQLLGSLVVAGGCASMKQAAVRALADVALVFGPADVDAALKGSCGALSAAGAEGIENYSSSKQLAGDAVGSHSVARLGKGLLELLITEAELLLAGTKAGPGIMKGRKPGRSAATKSAAHGSLSGSEAELLAVIAESLCKLLLYQRSWLRQYVHFSHTNQLARSSAAATAGASRGVQRGNPAAEAAVEAANSSSEMQQDSAARQHSGSTAYDPQRQQALLLRDALGLLLLLQFHPATESASKLRQCLSVFFDVFTAVAEQFQLQLVIAALRAARQALRVTSRKNPAALLVKYVLQLLQAAHGRAAKQGEGDGQQRQQWKQLTGGARTLLGDTFETAALQLLTEAHSTYLITVGEGIQPAKFKPYLSALLKVVCELPMHPSQQEMAVLQVVCDQLSCSVTDGTLKRDVVAVERRLQQLAQDVDGEQQLEPEQLERLTAELQAASLQQLPPLPGAADAASDGSVPATLAASTDAKGGAVGAATGRRTTSRATVANGTAKCLTRRRAAASSSSEDRSDTESDSKASSSSSEHDSQGGEQEHGGSGILVSGSKLADRQAAVAVADRRSSSRQPLGPSSIVNIEA